MWNVFVFASAEAAGSLIVVVFDAGIGGLEADVSIVGADSRLVSTAVAYDREARMGLNAGRAELRSRELDRRAAIVADVSRGEAQEREGRSELVEVVQQEGKEDVVATMCAAMSFVAFVRVYDALEVPHPDFILGQS
jgi:hypothetical protein